jgi:hypothetical protein
VKKNRKQFYQCLYAESTGGEIAATSVVVSNVYTSLTGAWTSSTIKSLMLNCDCTGF